MSSPKRAELRRARRAETGLHYGVAVMAGWALSESDLPRARQEIHDKLIAMLGRNRTGGVRWVQLQGDDANEMLTRLSAGDGNAQELLDHYRHLRAMLREYGGWLVVAEAPGGSRSRPS